LTELERAVAEDKASGSALLEFFLEEMLADPMIRLVMQADGVTEDEFRALHRGMVNMRPANGNAAFKAPPMRKRIVPLATTILTGIETPKTGFSSV
jgi:hypothetical protein